MNNYAAIEKVLADILPIAEKHAPDVERVVTVECDHCDGEGLAGELYSTWKCSRCHGTGRVLRDWSDLPDGALAGAWRRLMSGSDEWNKRLRYATYPKDDTDDLDMTLAVRDALRRTYG